MRAARRLRTVLLVSALIGGWGASPSPRAQQAAPIDPSALASFTWRALGLDDADVSRVTTDASFPYRTCALARGLTQCLGAPDAAGQRTWEMLPIGQDGPIYPDALDGDVVYTASLRRFDRRTGQAAFIGPELADQLRKPTNPAALALSTDGRTLVAGRRMVWRTVNAGQLWTAVSPDLLGDTADESARITALAVSPIDARVMWAGTSRGTVHVTRDGGATWVPAAPALSTDSQVTGVEPSRFDPQSAYVTTSSDPGGVAGLWRTRDGGASWTTIGQTLPVAAGVRAVREDLFRRGLLFAATDRSVYFSIDDGESWQSLQGNLPATAVSDILVRDADLIVATRGRGVWVLDDFSPLRQMTADVLRANVFLFRPPQTWRTRASAADGSSVSTGGPWNAGGVALSYLVGRGAATPLQLEVIETASGEVIRRFSSDPASRQPGDRLLSVEPGLRRVVWDLRYTRPEADENAPAGAHVLPGTYQVRLTAGGQSTRQAVAVRVDPRIRASVPDLAAQRTLARSLDKRRAEVAGALEVLSTRRAAQPGQAVTPAELALIAVREELRRFARAVNDVDDRPSAALEAAAADALARASAAIDAVP